MTQKEQHKLSEFEKSTNETILGLTKDEKGEMRRNINHEIDKELEGKDVITYIKPARIKLIEHVWRAAPRSTMRPVVDGDRENKKKET